MSQSDRTTTDERTAEILAAITPTFARKGLDGASMQDFAAAAGMSVGNFYRYFPSKLALVEAMVGLCAADVRQDFDAVSGGGDLCDTLRRLIEINVEAMKEDEAALWVQVDAAAVRHPEIAALKEAMEAGIRADVLALLKAGMPGAGGPLVAARLEELADFMVILVGGLFRRFAFAGPDARPDRLAALTELVIDTARDRIEAIRRLVPQSEAAE